MAGSTAQNTNSVAPVTPQKANQSGRLVNIPILPGATVRIMSAGTEFYFVVATVPVNARPDGGDFVLYQQGTGMKSRAEFYAIEIQNPSTAPAVVSCWVGFDSFIDNRLIIANVTNPSVCHPVQSANPPTATQINIPDLSGSVFTDINGLNWIAIQRQAILVFETSGGNTLTLQQYGATLANTICVGVIYPATAIRFDFSGNYSISLGGGAVTAIVSEIYTAVAYAP